MRIVNENKNIDRLESFTRYCEQNPSQRFMQALRNWYQKDHSKVNYILTAEIGDILGYENIHDTFYDD